MYICLYLSLSSALSLERGRTHGGAPTRRLRRLPLPAEERIFIEIMSLDQDSSSLITEFIKEDSDSPFSLIVP